MRKRVTANTAAQLYELAAHKYGELPAFASRITELNWKPVSFQELYELGLELATSLIKLGVRPRDHVGIFADNRFEWALADYAVQFCGAADVPRGTDITDDEIVYITNHARLNVVFVEDKALGKRLLNLRDKLPNLQSIIIMDTKDEATDQMLSITSLLAEGKKLRENGNRDAEKASAEITEDDLFTLIYTSGTTGTPKGVMITHTNVMSQMENIPIKLDLTDRILSILPIWHVLERIIELVSIASGACTYYTSARTLQEDMKNVEPTFMGSAPRLWETLYLRINSRIKQSHPVRQALFHIAYFLGYHYHESVFYLTGHNQKLRKPALWKQAILYPLNILRWILVLPWYGFFNAAVLEQIRKNIGGALKATISGGGALLPEIDKFFNYIGIPVLEGYGLTETSPVVSCRHLENLVVGTVGPPIPQTEIKIVDPENGKILFPNPDLTHEGKGLQGEIYIKGPQVMKGYYREPDLTESVLQNGWFRSGDLGMFTFNNCLKILGRLKSTIVLLNGENVEPEPIEMRLINSPFIDFAMLTGQDEKHLGVLIVPNAAVLKEKGVEFTEFSELESNEKAMAIIASEIKDRVNNRNEFKSFEKIRAFKLVPKPFEVGHELTNLQKMKRHVVYSMYQPLIDEMYHKSKVS